MNRLLKIREVAEICRVSAPTVITWIRAGKLPASRAGAQWRVVLADLKEFLNLKTDV